MELGADRGACLDHFGVRGELVWTQRICARRAVEMRVFGVGIGHVSAVLFRGWCIRQLAGSFVCRRGDGQLVERRVGERSYLECYVAGERG